jgi:hypothetical protein
LITQVTPTYHARQEFFQQPARSSSSPTAPEPPVCFRASPEEKTRFEAAAGRRGQSLTTFLREAAIKAAERAEAARPIADRAHGGVPGFFCACCWEASRGGEWGYRGPGYTLSHHLGRLCPYTLDEDEWAAELDALWQILEDVAPHGFDSADELAEDEEVAARILGWFDEHYPKCMKLVPRRRRRQFVAGVLEAVKDETIGLDL